MEDFPWVLPKNISMNLLSKFICKAIRTYIFYDEVVSRTLNIFRRFSIGETIHEISVEFKICTQDVYKIRRNIFLKYGFDKCNVPVGIFLIRDILNIKSMFMNG